MNTYIVYQCVPLIELLFISHNTQRIAHNAPTTTLASHDVNAPAACLLAPA